jgi:hypothetical protein
VAAPLHSAGDVRNALVGETYDRVDDIAVLDGRVLVGIVPIERLLAVDAVGTQTETVLIRGLSAGVPVRAVVHRELVTGAIAVPLAA